ncbi:MAG: DUF438 domain-containing protein [Eubacteriales bacterium]|nr:DUF438 domain-containing protein [Eubacteriales bacterium]
MAKKLDLSKPVYELVQEYPELTETLKELGFSEITKPAMLHSVGRITTIPKGAKMRKISMMEIIPALMRQGFEIVGAMPDLSSITEEKTEAAPAEAERNPAVDTAEQIKTYLKRLGAGESLEQVQKDFVQKFAEVEASEIMKAEQELIREGTPITEVQKLCDVHSALFHGTTKEEKIANAEKAVEASLKKEKNMQEPSKREMPEVYKKKHEAAKALRETVGHPLFTWTEENEKIGSMIHEVQKDIEEGREISEKMADLRQIAVHYAKKGDLIYPVLKVRYEISGPSDVMWSVDDEIRDELSALQKTALHDEAWTKRLEAVLTRADEMIYKEANILFPICAVNFCEEEWYEIYEDAKDYAPVLGVEHRWEEAEKFLSERKAGSQASFGGNEIVMGGGHMTVAQLEAMLNTLPLEISFIDADNINRFFNEGPKVFKRSQMAIDREVFSCHPPKIEPMVRAILDDFRNHKRDSVPVWMEKNGKPFLVTYMAVRDKADNYLGTVEVVQDMQFAKEHFAG